MIAFTRRIFLSFLLTVIILASSWSLLRNDFFRVHDYTQAARIIEMTQALKDGHFPVIWSSNLGYGFGMPLFEFYAPLPYYIGSLFFLLGLSLINSVKAIMIVSTVITALGGFFLGKKLFGNMGGLLVSSALTMAPYRAVNLFVRGAVSEAWGIQFLPLILLGIIKTIQREKYGWLLLTLSVAGLLLSHNLTALIFLPISVVFGCIYMLYRAEKLRLKNNKTLFRTLAVLVGCYSMGIFLSFFYSVPALVEKKFTRLDTTLLTEYFDYKLHFVGIKQFFTENWGYGGSTYGPGDGISFFLGAGQILAVFFTTFIIFSEIIRKLPKLRNKNTVLLETHKFLYFSTLSILLFVLLMSTAKLQFAWQILPFLKYLQFPWRFLSVAIVFLSLVVGSLVRVLPNAIFRCFYTIFFVSFIVLGNMWYFQPEEFSSNLNDYYYADPNKLRSEMSKTLPDYIPVQIKQEVINPPALQGQLVYCQITHDCLQEFEILENKVHSKILSTQFSTDQEMIFSIADFPGWSVAIDGKTVKTIQSDQGFLGVLVPAGDHIVKIYLGSTTVRKISNIISAFSFVVLLFTFFWYYKQDRYSKQKKT